MSKTCLMLWKSSADEIIASEKKSYEQKQWTSYRISVDLLYLTWLYQHSGECEDEVNRIPEPVNCVT